MVDIVVEQRQHRAGKGLFRHKHGCVETGGAVKPVNVGRVIRLPYSGYANTLGDHLFGYPRAAGDKGVVKFTRVQSQLAGGIIAEQHIDRPASLGGLNRRKNPFHQGDMLFQVVYCGEIGVGQRLSRAVITARIGRKKLEIIRSKEAHEKPGFHRQVGYYRAGKISVDRRKFIERNRAVPLAHIAVQESERRPGRLGRVARGRSHRRFKDRLVDPIRIDGNAHR